jgi:predicted metal-dependent hydrolase
MKSADKNVRDMWYWHTYEEVRHRSVSFDVYEEIGGGKLRRYFCFIFIYLFIGVMTFVSNLYLMAKDGYLFNVKFFVESHRFLWGKGGFLIICLPTLTAYFKKGYHPKQWTMNISDEVHSNIGNYDVLIKNFPTVENYPREYVQPYR